MIVLLLVVILFVLVFGAGWFKGILRGFFAIAALFIAGLLLKEIGISFEIAFAAALALIAAAGGFMSYVESKRKRRLAARRCELKRSGNL